MKKLLFLVAEDSYFCSHRLNLAKAAIAAGYQVAVATRCLRCTETIRAAQIQVFPLQHFSRAGVNPIRQFKLLHELQHIYRTYQPDIVHHVAIKPVIMGSLVAQWCGIKRVINALGGLGYLFTDPSPGASHPPLPRQHPHPPFGHPLPQAGEGKKKKFLRFFVCRIFRFIFSRPNSILILQNQDDVETLVKYHCLNRKRAQIIAGAGVDMNAFPITTPPAAPPVIIACVARLLWDKGIGELVKATEIIRNQGFAVNVLLYGMPDPENPASIPEAQILAWQASGIITWKGQCNDVAKAYAECHIAVLPSYREGLPKSLLEAASSGRPIVTTDVPGCREVVINGENGFLVPAKTSISLANALIKLIENEALRNQMGEAGRKRVAKYFNDPIIHEQTLALYAKSF